MFLIQTSVLGWLLTFFVKPFDKKMLPAILEALFMNSRLSKRLAKSTIVWAVVLSLLLPDLAPIAQAAVTPDPPTPANVALNKPLTSSSPVLGNPLDFITDGLLDYSYVALPEGPQWVQIDLQDQYQLTSVLVRHYAVPGWVFTYHQVVIQISTDGSNWTTIFNNDRGNSLGLGTGNDSEYVETAEGKTISLPSPQTARYVRAWSNGNSHDAGNHYQEVQVIGVPAVTLTPTPTPTPIPTPAPTATPTPPPVNTTVTIGGQLYERIPIKFYATSVNGRTEVIFAPGTNTPHGYWPITQQEFITIAKERYYIADTSQYEQTLAHNPEVLQPNPMSDLVWKDGLPWEIKAVEQEFKLANDPTLVNIGRADAPLYVPIGTQVLTSTPTPTPVPTAAVAASPTPTPANVAPNEPLTSSAPVADNSSVLFTLDNIPLVGLTDIPSLPDYVNAGFDDAKTDTLPTWVLQDIVVTIYDDAKTCVTSGGVQECLSTCGVALELTPAAPVAALCDTTNGLIYLSEGDILQAGASAIAVIPLAGSFLKKVPNQAAGVVRTAKILGRGSTADLAKGSTLARDMWEEFAVKEAMANPAKGSLLIDVEMVDPIWPATEGWVKMERVTAPNGEPIIVHYVWNLKTGDIDDFKIKLPR